MSRTIFAFLLVAVICLSYAQGDSECGENAIFTECGGCEQTCNSRRNEFCTTVCRVGCRCLAGYVRKDGKCILPKDC